MHAVFVVQGNTPRSPPPAATASSSSGGIELPSSPSGFQELYSRSRARRSSMVSTCSLASDSSLDRELDFGMTVCITLQVERMLQVGLLTLLQQHVTVWGVCVCVCVVFAER